MNHPDNRTIFHIDVNSAFLSWEAVHRLKSGKDTIDLRDIPSAIGGSQKTRHGIILAKSTPAKQYHITTGEPITSALQKCPDLVIVPPNFSIYTKRSQEFIAILKEYTDILQQVSIDEAYLDVTSSLSLFGDPVTLADTIRNRIRNELGFTVNVGISCNKLLAKMASDFEKPDKTHTLYPQELAAKMWPLPVKELYFVGKSAQKKCSTLGINTIGDLAHTDLTLLQSHFGIKYGQIIHNYANGLSTSPVAEPIVEQKGIGNSVTLSCDITDFESACQVLLSLAETVGMRLRQEHFKCSSITVELKDWNFKRTSHQTTLSDATNNTNRIYEIACQLLSEHWNHTPLRLLGIRTTKLTDDTYEQLSFFQQEQTDKQKKLDSAIDAIRDKFGTNSIKRASFLNNAVTSHIQGKGRKE